jgi:hypothetical protein
MMAAPVAGSTRSSSFFGFAHTFCSPVLTNGLKSRLLRSNDTKILLLAQGEPYLTLKTFNHFCDQYSLSYFYALQIVPDRVQFATIE